MAVVHTSVVCNQCQKNQKLMHCFKPIPKVKACLHGIHAHMFNYICTVNC